MSNLIQQILALNTYARAGKNLNENWATTAFSRTYAAALGAVEDADFRRSLPELSWYPTEPNQVTLFAFSYFGTEGTNYRHVPFTGELATAMFEELQNLANVRAEKEIRAERDRAIQAEARARVSALLSGFVPPVEAKA